MRCCYILMILIMVVCNPLYGASHHFIGEEEASIDIAKQIVGFKAIFISTPQAETLGVFVFISEAEVQGIKGHEVLELLSDMGYDIVIYNRFSASNNNNELFIRYALMLIESMQEKYSRVYLAGEGIGASLASRLVMNLKGKDQPHGLLLLSPNGFDEKKSGTVFSSLVPPRENLPRLLMINPKADDDDVKFDFEREYYKTWIGYDGYGVYSELVTERRDEVIKTFLASGETNCFDAINPAAVAVEGYNKARHAQKLDSVKFGHYDLIMIGNSITHNFEKPDYQAIWNQFYGSRNALNLGFSAYRTENLIWNIENGQLRGQSPKVVVLEIGTNNVDENNYPTRHTAKQLAGGIEAVVKLLRKELPATKIIILRSFPGCYGGPNPTSHRAILERASDIVSTIADGENIFYCDVNHVFLNMDGSINKDMLGDWLHPTPAGAKAWAKAMEPLLSELMGDVSRDTDMPANSAIVPVSKLEDDSYDWWARHAETLSIKDSLNPDIVLIGNSITHFWGGYPQVRWGDGSLRKPNGEEAWESVFGGHRVLNLGFGWDRTQNVLWRLDRGQLDGLNPKTVIIHIGTNNTSATPNASANTPTQIVEGIEAICMRVRSKVPGAKIVLMKVFPREQSASHARREIINEINNELEKFAIKHNILLLDVSDKMLTSDGTISAEIMSDFCHPTEKGYSIWADAIREVVNEYR